MKKVLAATTLLFLIEFDGGAQNLQNPCVEQDFPHCGAEPMVTFQPVTPNPNIICPGGSFDITAHYTTSDGSVVITSIHSDCSTTVSVVGNPPNITDIHWQATVAGVSYSGTGARAQFTPTTPGTGTLTFYLTYKGSYYFCVGPPTTITTQVNLAVQTAIQAFNDYAIVFEETPQPISVLTNDIAPCGGQLRVSSVTQGTHGSVTINPDNTVTYTPNPCPAAINLILPPAGQQFTVSAVNINGLACGSITLANGNTHAALWQVGGTGSGAVIDLDPTGTYSIAESINDSGTVVGYRDGGGGIYRAFKYSQGQMLDLSVLPGGDFTHSYAWGINNQGEICGQIFTASPTVVNHGFYLDKNNNVTLLNNTFGGSFIAAYGINDSSRIVGTASTTTSPEHAIRWQLGDAGPVDLASYFTIPNQFASGINAHGDIVGYTAAGSTVWAFAIQNGVFNDLSAGYQDSFAFALNAKGRIVGAWTGSQTSYTDRALYWQGNQHYDLNSLLPAGSGWVLNDPVWINENGLIVGNGTYQGTTRAFATLAPTIYEGPDTFTYTATDGNTSSSATVSVNVVDPNLDTDGDGLPDWWEMYYFGYLGVGSSGDPDGDGVSNYIEYLEGRNPRVPGTIPDSRGLINLKLYAPAPNF